MDDLDSINPDTLDDEGRAWLARQKEWRQIGRDLLEKLAPHLDALDPNWCEATLRYKKEAPRHENYVEGVVIDDTLTADNFFAVMNGPKNGDIDITALALECLGQALTINALRTNEGRRAVPNPHHRIELIGGMTMVSFENCEDGYVTNVNHVRQCFDIVVFSGLGVKNSEPFRTERYRFGQIENEMTWESEAGEAVGVSYFPRIGRNGVIASIAEYLRIIPTPEQARAAAQARDRIA